MVRAVIFDFFDVIRDDGLNRWLRKHGLTKSGKFLEITDKNDRGGYTNYEFFADLGKLTGESGQEVLDEMENNNQLNEKLVTYITEKLKDRYKIGLISNSESPYLRNELDKFRLEPLFDVIVISSEVGSIKPEPEIFQTALERLNVMPGESVFIDDNSSYVDAAKKLGLEGIVYRDFKSFSNEIEAIITKGDSDAKNHTS